MLHKLNTAHVSCNKLSREQHVQFISIPPPPHLLTSISNYFYLNRGFVSWICSRQINCQKSAPAGLAKGYITAANELQVNIKCAIWDESITLICSWPSQLCNCGTVCVKHWICSIGGKQEWKKYQTASQTNCTFLRIFYSFQWDTEKKTC